jgi:haloalkane dehalogenase
MRIYRTPDSCFLDLIDLPFLSNYIDINGLKMHYIDEGSVSGRTVLLLHGVPTWSYIYRKIIPLVADAGFRVVAPDLIGFGKSDKPHRKTDHSYKSHIDWMLLFIRGLKLNDIIVFGHDWGSLIGLRIAAEHPALFSGIIICNGMLPTGEHKIPSSFKFWRLFSRISPVLPVGFVIKKGLTVKPDKSVLKAYRAPFPSNKYKAGIRALPGLVPVSLDDPEAIANRIAWESLTNWNKPFLTIFGKEDPVTREGDKYMQSRIPGACGYNHIRLDGGHFIQEEKSVEITDAIIDFAGKAYMTDT